MLFSLYFRLMLACYAGTVDVAKVLRQNGARYTDFDRGGSAPIHWAVDGGHVKLLDWIIEDGADTNLRDMNSGWTPLIRCGKSTREIDVRTRTGIYTCEYQNILVNI